MQFGPAAVGDVSPKAVDKATHKTGESKTKYREPMEMIWKSKVCPGSLLDGIKSGQLDRQKTAVQAS